MRGLIAVAGLFLAAMGPSGANAQAVDPLNVAVGRGVGICRNLVEAGLEPSAVAAAVQRGGLNASPVVPALLESKLFPDSGPIVWLGLQSPRGAILIAVDRSQATCNVFLLGVPGRPALNAVASDLSGWKEFSLNDPIRRLMYLPKGGGLNLVVDMHDGGQISAPQAIGALFQVKIVRD
ncbi:MAG: hypothetical protein KF842_06510 [Caulobacter sp.]|nr:hypothetical protein [Caulobacter sp.]